jgi:ATP-binding cassette subfamily B multidrug efflux pump
MRRLGHYVRPYWIQATISSLAVSLKSLSDVTGPYLVKVAIDRYLTGHAGPATNWLTRRLPADPFHGITVLAEIYMGALLFAYFFEFIQTYLMQWTGQKIMFDLRRDIFRHMQRMHIGFFDTARRGPPGHAPHIGRGRHQRNVHRRRAGHRGRLLQPHHHGRRHARHQLVAGAACLRRPAADPDRHAPLPQHVRESYRRVRAAIARINSFTQEHISGMAVVQLFNREQRAYQDFEAVNRLHMIAFKDTIFAYALYYPASILSSVAIALVIWRGGFGVLHGVVTIGVLAMFIQYSQRFWRPIQDLSDKYNILQAAMAACERIFKLLDTAPEIVSPAHPVPATEAIASSSATSGSPIRN